MVEIHTSVQISDCTRRPRFTVTLDDKYKGDDSIEFIMESLKLPIHSIVYTVVLLIRYRLSKRNYSRYTARKSYSKQ